jgi:predicted TIM-barrel fold metal-dependent hydrolase
MIIDAHYHLEERVEPVDGLLQQMDRHGIDRVALIPAVNDPAEVGGIAAMAGPLLPKLLMSRLPHLGLRLYKSPITADGELSVLGTRYRIYDAPDNASVGHVLQAHPDRFFGWVFVNPRAVDPIAEMDRWRGQPRWIGAKSHPFMHRYSVALLDSVAAYCRDQEWPLLVHLGADQERGDFAYLPDRHPGLNIVYAHAGVPFYREVWAYARDKHNVFVDLSSPVYVSDRIRLEAVKALGSEKCVHGTDGPYMQADQGSMLEKVLRLPVSDSEKERILGGNFMGMIGA